MALKQEVTEHRERCRIRTAGRNLVLLEQSLLVESWLESTLWGFVGFFLIEEKIHVLQDIRKEAIMCYN